MQIFLNQVRTEKKMSIRELAEKSSVAKSHIEKIEAGEANPTIDVICRLSKALGVSAEKLFSCD